VGHVGFERFPGVLAGREFAEFNKPERQGCQDGGTAVSRYANMTPAQRLHAEMLAKLGLTEDQFKALPPAQQQKVQDKITDMIKKQMANSNDTRTGMITDKTA
jgi:hypothetical protein